MLPLPEEARPVSCAMAEKSLVNEVADRLGTAVGLDEEPVVVVVFLEQAVMTTARTSGTTMRARRCTTKLMASSPLGPALQGTAFAPVCRCRGCRPEGQGPRARARPPAVAINLLETIIRRPGRRA